MSEGQIIINNSQNATQVLIASDRVKLKPIVFIKDGEVFANSRNVAAYFGKQHGHVIRDIEKLIAEGVSNFGETPYLEPQNGQIYKTYNMTRDGFTLLAMGFTGRKALQFKLRYIEQFNAMEAELKRQPASAAFSLPGIDGQELAAFYQASLQQAVRRLANKAAKELVEAVQNLQGGAIPALHKNDLPAASIISQEQIRSFISHVVNHMVRYDDRRTSGKTIGEMIMIVDNQPDYIRGNCNTQVNLNTTKAAAVQALAQLGIRVTQYGLQQMVEITTTYEGFRRQVLTRTEWSGAKYRDILKAIPGAYSGKGNRYSARGINTPYVVVPIEALLQWMRQDEE